MVRPNVRSTLFCAAVLTLATALPAWCEDSRPTRITTARDEAPPAAPQPAGELNFTAYTGLGRVDGAHDRRDTPLEIDISTALAACPDGNTEISAMRIGGWRYNVAGVCDNLPPGGAVEVQGVGKTSVIASTRPAAEAGQDTVIRCDPATWRCGPAPP
jgi:hypothetical protein